MLLGTVPMVNWPPSESDVDSGRSEADATAEPLSAELAAALSVASKPPRCGTAGAAVRVMLPPAAGCAGVPLPSTELLVNDVVSGVVDDGVAEEAIATRARGGGEARSPYPSGMTDTADNLRLQGYLRANCPAALAQECEFRRGTSTPMEPGSLTRAIPNQVTG